MRPIVGIFDIVVCRVAVVGAVALMAVYAPGEALASISSGAIQPSPYEFYSGNGELVFSVFDEAGKVSYSKDLGLDLAAFFIAGQQETRTQTFWAIDDAQWQTFLSVANLSTSRWAIYGADLTGGNVAGAVKLFMTIQQGDEAKVKLLTNMKFSNAVSATTYETHIDALNKTSVADFTVNDSSVDYKADPGNAYFSSSSAGFSASVGGSGFNISNKIGDSSWFYDVSRSGPSQLGTVIIDEFDNLAHDAYWGFVYVDATLYPSSPYVGKYLLSYTLESSLPTATTAAGQLRANFLDYAAGFQARPLLNAAPGEFAGYQVSSLTVLAATPVPEPSTWGLFSLGLLGLAFKARRRA